MASPAQKQQKSISSFFTQDAAKKRTLDDANGSEAKRQKRELHEKFVQKLGRPQAVVNKPEADENEEENSEEEPEPLTTRKGPKKLTPLQKQVIDIKKKFPDTLLVVEVGYKFQFWGEDARIAAEVLSIVCIPGKLRFDEHPSEAHLNRFASASIPVHRLHVHVKRLVAAGHKVGIVRQLETAALKAAGDNKNKAFERGLTNLYTKGTYVDDEDGGSAGHMLCLTESKAKSNEKVQIGIVAVQPSTGDIIYDDFEDGWMGTELETRLLHISPSEFVLVGDVSPTTEKIISHLSGSRSNVFGDRARLERVQKKKASEARSEVTSFYAKAETSTFLDKIEQLSDNNMICLSSMINHLSDYKLEHVFDLTKNFQSFKSRSHMLLNGNTLTSLEVYLNQTDNTERGSLFWTLDRTKTKFGQRLLRKWVGRPLVDREKLEERVAAVAELKEESEAAERLRNLLTRIKIDLEKGLIRVFYQKCSRPELFNILQTLRDVAQEYSPEEPSPFHSPLLKTYISTLPTILPTILTTLSKISPHAAKEDNKYEFFTESHESELITDLKLSIHSTEVQLSEFKTTAATLLQRKSIDYVTISGIDYLIELPSTYKSIPPSWIKINSTKTKSRYHAPEIIQLLQTRDLLKEKLSSACNDAFTALLATLSSSYPLLRETISSLAKLDSLLSLSEVASQPGYVRPTYTATPCLKIKKARHPMIESLLPTPFIPNDISLDPASRGLLITGPNMGGKSSYVRSAALLAIMAQVGSYLPAAEASVGLLDAVFTRMGACDNVMKGESTFMVELGETSEILRLVTPRSLVVLDELGRGTGTRDGEAVARGVLEYLVKEVGCLTLFVTHYMGLAREDGRIAPLKNIHMRFAERSVGNETEITFLYEVGEGVAHRSYGLNVARLAGLPSSILQLAREKSHEMELMEKKRRLRIRSVVFRGRPQSLSVPIEQMTLASTINTFEVIAPATTTT
ncbi:DNA mismatch repair protein Msh3 [Piedraia hortae CBS 480.64]|uniref:MutS protein homolog 3 n=1 Tax=Piedraia hortae CBS 480.64 TaxID=1314780 RepID=A0A6A7C7T0_9PEZI|nr:DNA mismatch repair protein Msh3 [Piedraia hortae CBS 480.64]